MKSVTLFQARLSNVKNFLRILAIVADLGIISYGALEMYAGGFYARQSEGFHWYSIIIFLAVALIYLAKDRINAAYVIPIAVVYYCLHEAIFNIFFLSYHEFQAPLIVSRTWYYELIVIAIVTPVFLALLFKYTDRLTRFGKWTEVYLTLWVGFITLQIIWGMDGFPVSVDVYNILPTNVTPLANGFELATNLLFAIAFYSTFSFKRKESQDQALGTTDNQRASGIEGRNA